MLTDMENTMLQMLLSKAGKTAEAQQEKAISKKQMIINEVRFNINKGRAKSWIKKI
jgi:hypothetical protein